MDSTQPAGVETPPSPPLEYEKGTSKTASLARTISLDQRVSLPREILAVGMICVAQFTTQVALGQALSIIHIIGDHFNVTNPNVLSWLIAGYSLTVGTFILFSGRLGDLFGW